MSEIPATQTIAALHALKQPYTIIEQSPIPTVKDDHELLVKCQVIGLNPIDWKAPDFGFGIPALPYVAGRELSGHVVKTPKAASRLREGDQVIVISTDYRDLRKAAYQEYVVSSHFNVVKIPPSLSLRSGATIGVAFVATALALGVCMGIDFSAVANGPDLIRLVKGIDRESLPEDVRTECLDNMIPSERALPGDWGKISLFVPDTNLSDIDNLPVKCRLSRYTLLATFYSGQANELISVVIVIIWGGSSTSANIALQLARLAGLRVVTVVDKAKHGLRLSTHEVLRPDLLIDSHDPDRVVEILKSNFDGQLRFALDTRGRDSASALAKALRRLKNSHNSPPTPPATPKATKIARSHLVGLTGLPKDLADDSLVYHTVPIKIYHEVPAVGEILSLWLERLLEGNLLAAPDIIAVDKGFDGINKGLDRMRRGEISGGKAVVSLE